MAALDLGVVRRELLLATRGKRSQELVNRRLGFTFNQVHRWERGTTKLAWPDFVRLCDVCKVPIRRGLTAVLGYFDDAERADLLVDWLLRPAPVEYVTALTGISRATMVHWRAGRATPSLDDVLLLVHHLSCALVEVLGALVDLDALPSLADEVARRRARSRLLAEHPAVEAVLAALELEAYTADDASFVARHSGLAREEADAILRALVAIGAVQHVRGKYVVAERWFATFDARRDFDVTKTVKLHWLARAADRLARASEFSDEERFSYFVFSGSDDVVRAVDREYVEFIKRAIALVEAQRDRRIAKPRSARKMTGGSGRRAVRVLGLQLFAPSS